VFLRLRELVETEVAKGKLPADGDAGIPGIERPAVALRGCLEAATMAL
jgi:hypothetical protein